MLTHSGVGPACQEREGCQVAQAKQSQGLPSCAGNERLPTPVPASGPGSKSATPPPGAAPATVKPQTPPAAAASKPGAKGKKEEVAPARPLTPRSKVSRLRLP